MPKLKDEMIGRGPHRILVRLKAKAAKYEGHIAGKYIIHLPAETPMAANDELEEFVSHETHHRAVLQSGRGGTEKVIELY